MFENVQDLQLRVEELTARMSDPSVVSNPELWQKTARELASLQPIADSYAEYRQADKTYNEARTLLLGEDDDEMRELLKDEMTHAFRTRERLEEKLKKLLLPHDPNDDKDVVMEVRAGTGGEEAALFAADIYRMYCRYAEQKKWKTELVSMTESDLGGYKEIVFMIKGQGAYSRLKYESGVHRVQRVPVTESGGRIHTSTITVAVLPEADEVDIQLDPNDVRIDVFRASGNGGQCVNTTDSAVRVTHKPTGLVVTCQDEKSQLKNKEKALKVLKARLYDRERLRKAEEVSEDRRNQVGSGERSEKIRTYHFGQSRVTDHRLGETTFKIDAFMDGGLDVFIDPLITGKQAEQLKALEEE